MRLIGKYVHDIGTDGKLNWESRGQLRAIGLMTMKWYTNITSIGRLGQIIRMDNQSLTKKLHEWKPIRNRTVIRWEEYVINF